MAILARVLMLLACVPMLQPSGFCFCKTAGLNSGPVYRDVSTESHSDESLDDFDHCCCSNRNKFQPETPDGKPTLPAPCPTQEPDHQPGCPASMGVDRSKWVEPTQTCHETLPPLPDCIAISYEIAPANHFSHFVQSFNRSASRPLYLSHCALII